MSFANPRDALRAFAKGPADASRRRKRFFARIRSAVFLLAHARAPSPPFPFARIRPAREMELPESAMYVPACNPSSNRLLIVRATTIDPTAFADRFNAQWTASMLWTEAPDPCARGVGDARGGERDVHQPPDPCARGVGEMEPGFARRTTAEPYARGVGSSAVKAGIFPANPMRGALVLLFSGQAVLTLLESHAHGALAEKIA